MIQNSVESLLAQDYPRHLYEVYVISDGSADHTDEIARALGAKVLRTGATGFRKHRALDYAFKRLLTDNNLYVCIFDADNRIESNYLQEMNNAISAHGTRCLQCFHDVLNGPANWITKSLWVTCAASSRFYNPGRFRTLGTALICGTGWCCQASLLKQYWPLILTQTEDIELTGASAAARGNRCALGVGDAHLRRETSNPVRGNPPAASLDDRPYPSGRSPRLALPSGRASGDATCGSLRWRGITCCPSS